MHTGLWWGKMPPRHRCEANIKMHLKETGWEGVEWINLAQVRVQEAGCCQHSSESLGSTQLQEFLDKVRTVYFSGRTPIQKYGKNTHQCKILCYNCIR